MSSIPRSSSVPRYILRRNPERAAEVRHTRTEKLASLQRVIGKQNGMLAADVTGDGCDEIILGAAVLKGDGTLLWNTGLGHPDACYVADILPEREGLEIIYGIEPRRDDNAICLVDARTGEILWGIDFATTHVHSSGMFGDFDPGNPGMEFYIGEKDRSAALWNRFKILLQRTVFQ